LNPRSPEAQRFSRPSDSAALASLLVQLTCCLLCGENCSGKRTGPLHLAYSRWLSEGTSPSTIHHCHRVPATCLHQASGGALSTTPSLSGSGPAAMALRTLDPPHVRPGEDKVPQGLDRQQTLQVETGY
jgi:hypothetical protein